MPRYHRFWVLAFGFWNFAALLIITLLFSTAALAQVATGPLTVHPTNPRYFADGTGKAIYLTGSHTWNNLQDEWSDSFNPGFDFDEYLDFLQAHNHNFIRLWRSEMPKYTYHGFVEYAYSSPHPWQRTGPGVAGDGLPKFDLRRFDQSYFQRLRQRCINAGERGIYVSIMLFEGHSLTHTEEGWFSHPFNIANNINNINGDPNNDGRGLEINTTAIPAVLNMQVAYVRKVIDTVNDLDNIMYEIANETHGGAVDWQNYMIQTIKSIEATKPKQHPVLFSTPLANVGDALWVSEADAVSPGSMEQAGAYVSDPPPADGSKVIISDSDHLFGCGSNPSWVWRSFTRGMNVIYMDSWYDDTPFCLPPSQAMRDYLGYTNDYAQRMELARVVPNRELASTGYCLADPGVSYLVYAPDGGAITLNLTGAATRFQVEWFAPATAAITPAGDVDGGSFVTLTPPFAGEAVLFLDGGTGGPGDGGTGGGGTIPIDIGGDGIITIEIGGGGGGGGVTGGGPGSTKNPGAGTGGGGGATPPRRPGGRVTVRVTSQPAPIIQMPGLRIFDQTNRRDERNTQVIRLPGMWLHWFEVRRLAN